MNKKVFIYIILAIIILGLLFLTLFPNRIYFIRDSGIAGNAVSPGDKCTPPGGVSVEEWQTHMSHHPDMYRECFG